MSDLFLSKTAPGESVDSSAGEEEIGEEWPDFEEPIQQLQRCFEQVYTTCTEVILLHAEVYITLRGITYHQLLCGHYNYSIRKTFLSMTT